MVDDVVVFLFLLWLVDVGGFFLLTPNYIPGLTTLGANTMMACCFESQPSAMTCYDMSCQGGSVPAFSQFVAR